MRLGELCEINGKLAQYQGDYPVKGEPARMDVYVVSDFDLSDYSDGVDRHNVRRLIGQVPWSVGGASWSGSVRVNGTGEIRVITDGWERVTVRREVPKPRDGKAYTWKWSDVGTPGWVHEPFPRCGECRIYHAPAYVYCETCYECRPVKHKCRTSD